ncbi:hypothetical protein AB6809_32495, partial [Paraburkholderia sp. RCC_158]|uniref:hypothetical protein n=1 Tax=Paraburkholderia sp. RCC_158 TaxID=3239220 RepID=UPI0035265AF7
HASSGAGPIHQLKCEVVSGGTGANPMDGRYSKRSLLYFLTLACSKISFSQLLWLSLSALLHGIFSRSLSSKSGTAFRTFFKQSDRWCRPAGFQDEECYITAAFYQPQVGVIDAMRRSWPTTSTSIR